MFSTQGLPRETRTVFQSFYSQCLYALILIIGLKVLNHGCRKSTTALAARLLDLFLFSSSPWPLHLVCLFEQEECTSVLSLLTHSPGMCKIWLYSLGIAQISWLPLSEWLWCVITSSPLTDETENRKCPLKRKCIIVGSNPANMGWTFLRSSRWISTDHKQELGFQVVNQCWACRNMLLLTSRRHLFQPWAITEQCFFELQFWTKHLQSTQILLGTKDQKQKNTLTWAFTHTFNLSVRQCYHSNLCA